MNPISCTDCIHRHVCVAFSGVVDILQKANILRRANIEAESAAGELALHCDYYLEAPDAQDEKG